VVGTINNFHKLRVPFSTKEEIYLTLIQSMRSTEKGKRKKGEKKKRGKNIQPGHLISLRFFSKTFVIKFLGKCPKKLTNLIQFTLEK
jgi:hypothetical protein